MRVLITMPWGQRLGGAEAMLQTVLDGAHESGHELEPVFFEPGPWPDELARRRFSCRGDSRRDVFASPIGGSRPSSGLRASFAAASQI